jgi:hypothetical protein
VILNLSELTRGAKSKYPDNLVIIRIIDSIFQFWLSDKIVREEIAWKEKALTVKMALLTTGWPELCPRDSSWLHKDRDR